MEFTWIRLPIHLIGQISSNALILLSWMLNRDTGSHTVVFRQKELAELLHCSLRMIDHLFRELEQAGLILSRERLRTGTKIELQPDILPPRKGNAAPHMPKNTESAANRKPSPQPKEYSSITPDMLDAFF